MRILYHHRTQGEEPESIHIASIVSALRELGHEVEIVGPVKLATRRAKPTTSLLGRIKRRLPAFAVELLQMLYNAKSFLQLALAHRRHPCAFLYERYALYNVAGIWFSAIFRVPLVLEVNTPYAQAWSKYYGLAFPRFARFLERRIFRRADRIITVTARQRELIVGEGVDAQRIVVCHNAIDPADFATGRYPREQQRNDLGFGSWQGLVAGFVGTMNRWQGVHGFADVVRRVAAMNVNVRFVFVGDGEGRQRLMDELDSSGLLAHVRFLGRQPHAEIPRLLSAMDIGLLLDSNAYGSPMKVFEYWGAGLAVIAPRVPPVLEIMEDGVTGLLIEPGDAAAMAAAIQRLAGNPALLRRLGGTGRENVLSKHVWSENARMIISCYESCRAVARASQAGAT